MSRENVTGEIAEIREALGAIASSLSKLAKSINRFDLIDCLELSEKRLIEIMTWGDSDLQLICKVKSEKILFYGKRSVSDSANVYWDNVRSVSIEERFLVEKFFSFDPFETYGEHMLVSDGTDLGLIEFNSLEFYLEF